MARKKVVPPAPAAHQHAGPTVELLERNITALLERRRAEERGLSWQDRLADRITRFAGSMQFVWLHAVVYGLWILINIGLVPGVPRFDPTFVILAMQASVEAIFLSTFILITQNRMRTRAYRRADLNLQISLLAEHEVTRLVQMVSEIGQRMGVPAAGSPELNELKSDIHPEEVLDELERRNNPSQDDE